MGQRTEHQMLNPAFIVGVPRSGTTLLRVILDSHSRIAAAPETPWILGGYGAKVSFRDLVCGLIDHNYGPVKNMPGVTETLVLSGGREFLCKILESYVQTKHKDILVLKTPDDVQYLEFLIKLFPQSTYIHIFRDGRDVACSAVNKKGSFLSNQITGYGELNYENAMRRWHDWENKARIIFNDNKMLRHVSISYEDLVSEPQAALKRVCDLLNVEFEESMLDYARQQHDYPAWEAGSFDVKARTMINRESVGKWRNEIPRQDLKRLELKYGRFLQQLGYGLSDDDLNVKDNENQKPVNDTFLISLKGIAHRWLMKIKDG
jgi:protein-tyrosine sulfotransferase